MFPTLTAPQVERVRAHGRVRKIAEGDVLFRAGDQAISFFVIVRGHVEIVGPAGDDVMRKVTETENLIWVYGPGQFNGEINMISGRRALGTGRVVESGEAIELSRDQLLALVQTDTEIGAIIMRAFILRRMGLLENHVGDVVIMGSLRCGDTL